MTTLTESTEPVNTTLGDTLTQTVKDDLHLAAQKNSEYSSVDDKVLSQLNECKTSVETFVKSHPYQSAGIAVAAGAILFTLFSGRK